MFSWNLPKTVTSRVAVYIPALHVMATVDRHWKHIVGCAKRNIIQCFLCSSFDVHCLRDLIAMEDVRKPILDKICRSHLRQPSGGIPNEVLFWYEAQLHLGLLCKRNPTSLRDVLQRCFKHSTFGAYGFGDFFPESRLTNDMHLCIDHFDPGGVALVEARDMGCSQLGRSVNEVLMRLWCMSVGACYCRCHREECGASFTVICFQDPEFPRCVSCGAIPMRAHQKARLPLRFQCAACRQ